MAPSYFSFSYTPLLDDSGAIGGIFCSAVETTAAVRLAQAQEALRRADRQKDDFLATLAHELRNPLAPLRTGLHVLQRGTGTPEEQRVRNIMQRQLDHMVRPVDELLDIARISQGKIVLSRETLQLQLVLQHAVDACRPLLDAQGHTLSAMARRHYPAGSGGGQPAEQCGQVHAPRRPCHLARDGRRRGASRNRRGRWYRHAQGCAAAGVRTLRAAGPAAGARRPGSGSRFLAWLPRARRCTASIPRRASRSGGEPSIR
jgi:His Kinase A (phospho-acceptor) domain